MRSKFLPMEIIMSGLMLALSACGSAAGTQETAATLPVGDGSSGIVAEGRVEPIRYADIALNASGLVSEVLSAEGEQVKAGQVIARLENVQARTLDSALASALQELTNAYDLVRDAQFELDEFDVPSDFSGMTAIEAVRQTLDKLNAARRAFEPYKYLSERRLSLSGTVVNTQIYRDTAKQYKKRLDDAWGDYRKAVHWLELESNLATAKAHLDQAQKDSDSLQDSSFAEDTAGARAALANAEVRAPFAGTITNLDLKVGEFASIGQPVLTIADLTNWVVKTTDLTEIDVVDIEEGQPVTLTLDAIPGIELKGNVLSIGKGYTEKQGDIIYEVTILLKDVDPGMRWGMTAQVKFVR
jgi:multidrug resistance efflux pump